MNDELAKVTRYSVLSRGFQRKKRKSLKSWSGLNEKITFSIGQARTYLEMREENRWRKRIKAQNWGRDGEWIVFSVT